MTSHFTFIVKETKRHDLVITWLASTWVAARPESCLGLSASLKH